MKSALLIIDVQHGRFAEKYNDLQRPFEAAEIVARINTLSRKARAAKASVIFIQHEHANRSDGFLAFDTETWQLDSGLHVEDGDIKIRKTTPDSFLRTDLSELLKTNAVERVVICGFACEFCVDTTTRRAAALGYPVMLAADAHTTMDNAHITAKKIRAHHNLTLSNIASFGVNIEAIDSADVSFWANEQIKI